MKNGEASLHRYAVIVCELGESNTQHLTIRVVVDLTSGKIGYGDKFGLITNDPNLPSVVTKAYDPNVWRFFGKNANKDNWLKVKKNNIVVAFLVHSGALEIFDIVKQAASDRFKSFALKDSILTFVQTHLIDHFVIRSEDSPTNCEQVNNVLSKVDVPKESILDSWLQEHNPSDEFGTSLSVSRCGTNKRFDLRSYKNTIRTPNQENICEDVQKYVPDDVVVPMETDDTGATGACSTTPVSSEKMSDKIEWFFGYRREVQDPCGSEDVSSQRSAESLLKADRDNARKKIMFRDPNYEDRFVPRLHTYLLFDNTFTKLIPDLGHGITMIISKKEYGKKS